jgi:hypothetical protein
MQAKHLQWLIFSLALFKIAFHLYFYDMLEPHRDELLYFSLGTHPASGYASVPPMIGILAFLLMKTIGFSAFAIKILPAILGGIMIWLTAKITEELGGNWFAQLLAALGIFIAPIFVRPFYLYQPVCFDIFFWTLIFYFVIRYLNTRQNNYLLYLGIAAGFAILNKHLVVLQLGSLFIAFLLSSERKVLVQKSFGFAILFCLIIASPNIIWQLSHGLSSVRHLGALNKHQLTHLNRINFLKEQLLMPGIFLLLTTGGLLALIFTQKLSKYRVLGITMLFVTGILFAGKGKGYYTAGIFPLALAAGAVWWEGFLKQWYLRIPFASVLIAFSIVLLPIGIPIYKPEKLAIHFKNFSEKYGMDGMLRHEDGKIHSLPQDYADMIGWEELTRITNTAYQKVPDKRNVLLYCENYGQASAINILGKKYGLPEPVSFSDNYYYWAPRKIPASTDTFIYVNDELGEDVQKLFTDIQLVGQISDPLAREYGTSVYLCRNPRSNFSKFWFERVAGLESPF